VTGVTPLPLPPVGSSEPWAVHNRELAGYAQRFLTVLIQGMQRIGQPVQLPLATVSQLTGNPSVYRPVQGRTAYCTDMAGTSAGAPVWADGSVWRIYGSNGTVS